MLDHLVYATPDLARTVDDLAERGITLSPGGPHPGLGTRNHLAALGENAFLEVIGPDPEQPEPATPRPFGIDELTAPRLVTWAIQVPDLDAALDRARVAGHEPGDAVPMSRRRPDGVLLSWRLAFPPDDRGGLVPFVIGWGDTPHPSRTAVTGTRLISLRGEHPDPASFAPVFAALDTELAVTKAAEPALVAEFATTSGALVLK
ncbi:VOC family protein [Saccharothrix sp. AJ9571]|nr:VOC family protein [Saccharothrix sp. AJ9571]